MAYNFTPFKEKIKMIEEWQKREFTGIRTGQAAPAILDGIKVESYGTQMQIPQIAAVAIEDARTLRISPWDVGQIKDIEKAIIASNLGLSVRPDETSLHVSFPQLTSERRTVLMKLAKEKNEEARISLRKERERVLKDIEAKGEEGTITEDETKRLKVDIQKLIDEANKKFEETLEKKEKEIAS